jgi:myo-inositol-1(or 4)-monophosphatase
MDYAHELEIATSIAYEAGKTMLRYFDGDQQQKRKADGSPVTIADTTINSMVITRLQTAFPDDGVIGEEESTTEYGNGRKWFCDPVDGTKAYTWGVPTSTFSLGLIIDGQPTVGVVYDPYLDKLYTAVKGRGSFCNGRPVHVSDTSLNDGIVAVTSDPRRLLNGPRYIAALAETKTQLATFSGAVYKAVLVAKGRLVGYIEEGVNAYDIAAVETIVAEAGGRVTDLEGNRLDYTQPFRGVVISNGVVHDRLLEMTK